MGDEFLKSVKKTRMKYQEMLQSDDNDLQEKTVKTASHEKSGNNPKQIFGTKSSNPEPLKDVIQENENCTKFDGDASKNIKNKKLFDSNITPTPSPRIKKRIRREQFLQEHKEMGKSVLKMAKSTVGNHELTTNSEGKSNIVNCSETTAADMNILTSGQAVHSSNCKIDTETQIAKDGTKNTNMLMRGEIVDNMNNEIENLKHVILANSEEIQFLKSKCEECDQEKLKAVNDLRQTQVMSDDQLEKLYNLEAKQDLLEVENSRIKECLEQSDENNKVLSQDSDILQSRIIKLHSENEKLIQTITKKEIYIQQLLEEIEEIKAQHAQSINIEINDKTDCENKLRFKDKEIAEVKQEMKQLEICYSKSMKNCQQQKIKYNSELS